MTTVAILIGFNYVTAHDDSLLGACVDIYQMYRYCRFIEVPSESIYVITDMVTDVSPGNLRPLIADDIVDVNIGTFLSTLKERGTYIHYRPLSLFDQIRLIATRGKVTRLLVYFTGHGITGPPLVGAPLSSVGAPCGLPLVGAPYVAPSESYLKMPDGTAISISSFHTELGKSFSPEHSFIIYDCCHFNPSDLPYRYIPFRRTANSDPQSRQGYLSLTHPRAGAPGRIHCIAASSVEHKAASNIFGSLFTRHLLNLLMKRVRGYEELYTSLFDEGLRNVTLWSNQVLLPYLEPWVIGKKNVEISYDTQRSCLLITLEE